VGSASQHAAWALTLAFIAQITLLDDYQLYVEWYTMLMLWAVFLLGSIFPDIDCCSSKVHRWLLFPRLYGTRFKHWGHCHSIVGSLLFGAMFLPFAFIDIRFILLPIFYIVGYILHLVVDEGYKAKGNKRHAFKWW
jgi:uncharacterized metal-binding protein